MTFGELLTQLMEERGMSQNELARRTDADILETLAACKNVQGYIKSLIRADVSAPTEDGNAR